MRGADGKTVDPMVVTSAERTKKGATGEADGVNVR